MYRSYFYSVRQLPNISLRVTGTCSFKKKRNFINCSHILEENSAKRPIFIANVCDNYFCTCALCLILVPCWFLLCHLCEVIYGFPYLISVSSSVSRSLFSELVTVTTLVLGYSVWLLYITCTPVKLGPKVINLYPHGPYTHVNKEC
jgi:hypothetical protein